jgi:hypothetical protein
LCCLGLTYIFNILVSGAGLLKASSSKGVAKFIAIFTMNWATLCCAKAVFLVVCDPSMNEV